MLGGVILAGGRNRRMGGHHKALLPIGGQPLLLLQLNEMARLCSTIWIVSNTPEQLRPAVGAFDRADVQWIPDIYPHCGPIGGIHAACSLAKEHYLWMVGCDMPMISAQAAKAMLEVAVHRAADGVVPVINGKRHPLHAIYHRAAVGASAENQLLKDSYKLMAMLDSLCIVSLDEAFFRSRETGLAFVTNMNTPEDYAKADSEGLEINGGRPSMTRNHELRFGRKAVSLNEARSLLLPCIRRMLSEQVPLAASFGRTIAVPVYANHPVPHFQRSGVDGYAVRAEDIAAASPEQPVELMVVDDIPSGTMPTRIVRSGQAARIMTGAPVPDGADAVVMLEMTDSLYANECGLVKVKKALPCGSNMTPIAGEIKQGEMLLEQGTRIGPGEAAILAAFGMSEVEVYRKPRVAIFSTGSELLDVGDELRPGRIRNSNAYMLAAQVEAAGGVSAIMPPLSDNATEVEEAFAAVLDHVDMVITTGGVSVGDYDVMVELFGRWDGKLLFNKIAMRPGSPTSAAVWKDKLLLALSGNPGAAFVGFELLVRPLLLGMQGSLEPFREACSAYLEVDYDKGSAYPRYVRGTMRLQDGKLMVKPAGEDKSSMMISIKDANCLMMLPARGSGFVKGERVLIYML